MTNGNGGDALPGDILRSIAAEYKWKDWGVIEKAVAPVGAATLARYAGNYQLGPMTIAVTQTGTACLSRPFRWARIRAKFYRPARALFLT